MLIEKSHRYLKHFLLLARSVATFTALSVPRSAIRQAEKDLDKFYRKFSELYPGQVASLNLHLVSHLADNVREHGPFWAYSCFSFESYNRRIKQLCHGLRNDAKLQICRRVYTDFFVKLRVEELGGPGRIDPEVKKFISRLDVLKAYLTDEEDHSWEKGKL